MIETMRNNLIINEEKTIKNTLLYIRNLQVNTESYESKILAEENIENIIKYQIVYEGENRVLKYDVSNTIGFDEYLKTKRLKKDDICKIISAIDDILFSVENYLLSESSIALDLKLIRVTKNARGSMLFKFIAIPNYNSDFSYELSKFLIRILRHVDVEDKEALTLAYGLFVRSSKDNYTMNDLMELIDKVYDKKTSIDDDFNIEELIKYDEEMASEISEEIIAENQEKALGDEIAETVIDQNLITSTDDDKLIIDASTKEIIGDSLLNDFDKEDEKIEKSNKKPFLLKKNKALKGNISLSLVVFALVPMLVLALPIIYFFVYV